MRRTSSLYYRLIVLFLVTIIPLYVLSFMLNDLSMKDINEQKMNTISAQAKNTLHQFEREIQRISSYQHMFLLYDENLIHFSSRANRMSAYELGKTVRELYKHLISIKMSSDFIADIFVYSPSQQKGVSTSGYYHNAFTDDELAFYTVFGKPDSGILKYTNDRLHLSFNDPIIESDWMPLNFVQVELSIKEIQNMLRQIDEHGGAALVGTGWMITDGSDMTEEFIHVLMHEGLHARTSKVNMDGKDFLVTVQASSMLDTDLVVYVPEHKILNNLMQYRNLIWALLVISICVAIAIVILLDRMIKKPLRKMVGLFMEVEYGNYDVTVDYAKNDELGYLFRGFRKMLTEIKRLINETYVQKIRLKNSELKQLQSQINPHFLYNTFNILRQLIKYEDYETAQELLKHLGGYFHFITRNDKDDVTLDFEYEHIVTYLGIQKIRYQERIDLHIDPLPEACKHIMVPRLILQPVVENAYKYAFSQMISGGVLKVYCMEGDHHLSIVVEDNGPGLSDEELSALQRKLMSIGENEDHTGLINIHRRLQLKFGDEGRVEVSHAEPQGFRVNINIPKDGGSANASTADRG